jgi:hypothetical protein
LRSRCLVFGSFVLGSVVSGGSDGDESGEDDELKKKLRKHFNFNNLRQFDCRFGFFFTFMIGVVVCFLTTAKELIAFVESLDVFIRNLTVNLILWEVVRLNFWSYSQ